MTVAPNSCKHHGLDYGANRSLQHTFAIVWFALLRTYILIEMLTFIHLPFIFFIYFWFIFTYFAYFFFHLSSCLAVVCLPTCLACSRVRIWVCARVSLGVSFIFCLLFSLLSSFFVLFAFICVEFTAAPAMFYSTCTNAWQTGKGMNFVKNKFSEIDADASLGCTFFFLNLFNIAIMFKPAQAKFGGCPLVVFQGSWSTSRRRLNFVSSTMRRWKATKKVRLGRRGGWHIRTQNLSKSYILYLIPQSTQSSQSLVYLWIFQARCIYVCQVSPRS